MTTTQNQPSDDPENLRPSTLLPFDPADLVSMRVKPAQFARMCKVSKQAVSVWIREGKITLGPDGLLDPVVASRQVFERTDPGRLRARVFKNAVAPYGELQARVRELESQLAEMNAIRHLYMHQDEIWARGEAFLAALAFGFDDLASAQLNEALDEALDDLWSRHFLRQTEESFSTEDEK